MKAYVIKVNLQGSDPLIWRQITIPCNITCKDMANILLIAMGWGNGFILKIDYFVNDVYEENRSVSYYLEKSKCFIAYYNQGILREVKCVVTKVIDEYSYSYPIIDQAVGVYPSIEDEVMNHRYDIKSANEKLKKYFTDKKGILPIEKSLVDVLNSKTVVNLRQIARDYELKGYWKLRKKELVDFILEKLLDINYLKESFLFMDEDDYALFQLITKSPVSTKEAKDNDYCIDWLQEGLFIDVKDDIIYAVKELKELFESINSFKFKKEKEQIDLVIKYEDALLNVYGICPLETLVLIYNKYEKKVTLEYVKNIIQKSFLYRDTGARLINNDLVRVDFVSQTAYETLKRVQEDKNYYIPNKEEILYFTSDKFLWNTVQVDKLKLFLYKDLKLKEETAKHLCIDITKLIHVGYEMHYIFKIIEKSDVVLSTKEQLEAFSSLLIQVWNNTRMVALNGYTPEEVRALENSLGKDKKVHKVYPNSPCPCGSGKKFKYCCGKC